MAGKSDIRQIAVGIMSAKQIRFLLYSDASRVLTVSWQDGRILFDGHLHDTIEFDGPFTLYDVHIGIDFHWSRYLNLSYQGRLRFIVEEDRITAVNSLDIEDYLFSVISSEMSPTASVEYLKAHAVISRSWVCAQLRKKGGNCGSGELRTTSPDGVPVFLKWWGRGDHANFDVCADDHCQRYQGIPENAPGTVRDAIEQTRGQVLRYRGELCDARFSKCCGGTTELFSSCWDDTDYPYLASVRDSDEGGKPYCNTSDVRILAQVMKDYDRQTTDFFEWEVRYSADELSGLVNSRSGMDFGRIKDLIPIERGPSGRIIRLKIVGEKTTEIIGKELLIRRVLSPSHLKSSAFEISRPDGDFLLRGHGWGHGVGFCQIGAAVMADRGMGYAEILQHYYPGSNIENYE